jgi:hypothetical protein
LTQLAEVTEEGFPDPLVAHRFDYEEIFEVKSSSTSPSRECVAVVFDVDEFEREEMGGESEYEGTRGQCDEERAKWGQAKERYR